MTSFEPVEAWGDESDPTSQGLEADLEDQRPSERLPQKIEIGLGIYLWIDPDVFRRIMRNPEIETAVEDRGQELADAANSMSIVPGAEYVWVHSTNPDNIRARGRVKTGNRKAQLDDDWNATLLKALSSVGSDPYPSHYWKSGDSEYGFEEHDLEAELEAEAPAEPVDAGDVELPTGFTLE
jgi:hypothetical protein